MSEGVVKRATAWSLTVSGAGAVLWAAVAPVVTVPEIDPSRLSTPSHASSRLYPADSLARLAVSRDLFRAARRPASLAYDPSALGRRSKATSRRSRRSRSWGSSRASSRRR